MILGKIEEITVCNETFSIDDDVDYENEQESNPSIWFLIPDNIGWIGLRDIRDREYKIAKYLLRFGYSINNLDDFNSKLEELLTDISFTTSEILCTSRKNVISNLNNERARKFKHITKDIKFK